jgi:hypothetical protein
VLCDAGANLCIRCRMVSTVGQKSLLGSITGFKPPKARTPLELAVDRGFKECAAIIQRVVDSFKNGAKVRCIWSLFLFVTNCKCLFYFWKLFYFCIPKIKFQNLLLAGVSDLRAFQFFIGDGAVDIEASIISSDGQSIWTPLQLACRMYDDDVKVVECLLRAGADIEAKGENVSTPKETII